MNQQNEAQPVTVPVRRKRWLRVLIGLSIVVLILILVGVIYESISESSDARTYPPPGQMVDVGGHRLHLNCTGTGSPTVVIEAGLGGWSNMWGGVQPDVAKTTKVCTYDRAGMGWSDVGPQPRDAQHLSKELYTLLKQANVPGPYVMIGHSLGGFVVRQFVHDHPAEVAGVVLIESMHPKQMIQPISKLFSPVTFLARVGIVRLLAKPLGLVPTVPADQEAYFSRSVTPQFVQTFMDESQGMPASGKQAETVTTFGDIPLIILTARLGNDKAWQTLQTELLQLSSHSEQLFADKSTHDIELDQPAAAVNAIVKMIEKLRQK